MNHHSISTVLALMNLHSFDNLAYNQCVNMVEQRAGHDKAPEQHEKAAQLLAQGKPIRTALIEAGYSPKQAAKGKKALTAPILNALAKHGKHLRDMGRQALIDPTHMHELAVGRTMYAALTGDSKGLDAAKQLGSHKSVNCWQQDVSTGTVIIQMQQPMQDALAKPTLALPDPDE